MLNGEKSPDMGKEEKQSASLHSIVLPQKLELSLSVITSLFTVIYFFLGSAAGFIIFNSDLGIERYGIILAIAVIPIMGAIVPEKLSPLKLYLKSFAALNFILLMILSSGNLPMLILSFAPAAAATISLVSGERHVRRKNSRLAVFIGVFLFMLYIGEFVTIASGSLSNNIVFIPSLDFFLTSSFSRGSFFLYAGVIVLSPHLAVLFSPEEYALFFAISVLVSENYYRIVSVMVRERGLKGRQLSSLVYGLTGAFSCQCEGLIALLPVMTALLLSFFLFPLILESLAFLYATFYLTTKFYMEGKPIVFPWIRGNGNSGKIIFPLAVLCLFAPQFLVIIGVYYSLQHNPLFFLGSTMLMVVPGYVFGITMAKILPVASIPYRAGIIMAGLGVVISSIWYFPYLTGYAYANPSIFAIMNITVFTGGVFFGLSYKILGETAGKILNEFITVIFSFIPVIVYYYAVITQRPLWSEFSIIGQIEFSLLTWAIMLPLMWLTTHVSLNTLVARRSVAASNLHTETAITMP
ncbi:MAG: hypothetical protein M1393_04660 [Candidatus Thermoplasmatota archaeon]|nr:hypothetical protein [Candidatus Thermoplasmatota archaeon]MDA8143762.1 hypothetical protein [Thermoplasmatales archaeon]